MPITDALMALGNMKIPLLPDTPPEARAVYEPILTDHTTYLNTIVVTPGRVLDEGASTLSVGDYADLLTLSIWTGRAEIMTRGGPGERFTVEGPSALAWLGDANGKGSFIAGSAAGGSTQLFNRLGQVFGGTPAQDASFDLQIHWTNNSVGVTVTDDVDPTTSQRANLDRLRVLGGNAAGTGSLVVEYYAAPTLKLYAFDAGDYTWFRGDSRYVLGPGLAHEERDDVRVIPAAVKVIEDYSDWARRIDAFDTAGHGGAKVFLGPNMADGVSATTNALRVVAPQTQGTASSNEMKNRATNLANTDYAVKFRYTITLQAGDARQFITEVSAGSRIYVFDPERAQSDGANPIMVNGHEVGCNLVRLNSITWPLLAGMGVYAVRTSDGSLSCADLSNHVDYAAEPKQLMLGVGERARTLTGIVRGF